jgi:outer membrane protein assembly factor BamE
VVDAADASSLGYTPSPIQARWDFSTLFAVTFLIREKFLKTMHSMKTLIVLFFALAALYGCATTNKYLPTPGVPFVHKVDVQQGNVITQEMVGQLRLGMNKKKVRFVMGTPIIKDTFHSNRWDYIYTFKEGGGSTERHLITALFNEDEKLINLEGNIKAALGPLQVNRHQDTSVNVPEDYKKGIFVVLKESIPFTGEDEPKPQSDDDVAEKDSDAADAVDEEDDDEKAEMLAKAQAAKSSVTVPEGAPPEKKKGFFKRIVDAIGIGAEDDDEQDDDEEDDYDPNDPKYRDLSDPSIIKRSAN